MGERAHMTGRAMDPLPSPAVAAAAEAEADEEADPPATGRARGPMALCGEPGASHSGTTCRRHTSPGREGVGGQSWGQPLPSAPWDAALSALR